MHFTFAEFNVIQEPANIKKTNRVTEQTKGYNNQVAKVYTPLIIFLVIHHSL